MSLCVCIVSIRYHLSRRWLNYQVGCGLQITYTVWLSPKLRATLKLYCNTKLTSIPIRASILSLLLWLRVLWLLHQVHPLRRWSIHERHLLLLISYVHCRLCLFYVLLSWIRYYKLRQGGVAISIIRPSSHASSRNLNILRLRLFLHSLIGCINYLWLEDWRGVCLLPPMLITNL